jgi:ketosteroid isomerase-like protein
MKLTAAVLAASLCFAVGDMRAQAPRSDSAAAAGAVEQFHAALAAGDSAKAMSLLADDVMILESGAVQTRADYLGGHLGADMKASQGSKAERTLVKVTIMGDAAYVVSRSLTPATGAQGSTGSETAELVVLSKSATGWKIRAIHWSSRRRRS